MNSRDLAPLPWLFAYQFCFLVVFTVINHQHEVDIAIG